MAVVVFVAPFFLETTLRFVRCVADVPDTHLVLVSQESKAKLPPDLKSRLAAYLQIEDALDADHIGAAVADVRRHTGNVHRIIGALEQLQEPLAEVRERYDIPGMDVPTAKNFRDKARMKDVLRRAGVPCARHRMATSPDEAWAFVREAGFPVVVKPPEGAGAKSTFRLEHDAALREYLETYPVSPSRPTLLEEFIVGREHSFDSICIHGRPVWHSISRYYPTPLEVLENPWIQWCVVLPREIDGEAYQDIRRIGFQSLEVLGMHTGLSHLEWFRRDDGSVAISEVAARPPGAQFTTVISYAYDFDLYRAWAELMVHDRFTPPERRYAAGIIFLRGQGHGERIRAIHGLGVAQREVGALVVEAHIPKAGQPRASTYEGDGFVIVRHPETEVVERALSRMLNLIRVEVG
jgi:biotin carboxylase